jgi:hypothetical protein
MYYSRKAFRIEYKNRFVSCFELRTSEYPSLEALDKRAAVVAEDFVRIELDLETIDSSQINLTTLNYIPPHQMWDVITKALKPKQCWKLFDDTTGKSWVEKFQYVQTVTKSKKIRELALDGLKACEERHLQGSWAWYLNGGAK